jgi:hypothetical protein
MKALAKSKPLTREDRVASALRENLRKRKEQLQTRARENDKSKDKHACP